MKEIWKDIPEYEGHYQVSNLGRVRALDRIIIRKDGRKDTKTGRIMSIRHNKRINVYETYLSMGGKRKCFKIHRLVASVFIYNDDPVNKTTVNHIDGDRSNNAVQNLEWCSYSDNLQHAYDYLNRPINRTSIRKRPCKSIDDFGDEIEYESIAQASRNTLISETQIRRLINEECINNKYRFEYI